MPRHSPVRLDMAAETLRTKWNIRLTTAVTKADEKLKSEMSSSSLRGFTKEDK